jgi:hypothetical protein
VIAIGSLLWDHRKCRPTWRRTRLDMTGKKRVYLPIRYGRHADTWDAGFTMCFSIECVERGMGTAWVLPATRTIPSFEALLEEASQLGRAEGFDPGNDYLFSSWGAVALMPREPSELVERWKDRMRGCTAIESIRAGSAISEPPCISKHGLLDLAWPTFFDPTTTGELDLLLATVTRPKADGGVYASPQAVAEAMFDESGNLNDGWTYFDENRRCGIHTFQDAEIQRHVVANLRQ